MAFETARDENLGQEALDLGKKVLIISFLVIVTCAPIGAAAIQFTGPRLLRQESPAIHVDSSDHSESTGTVEPHNDEDTSEPFNVVVIETSV